MRIKQVNIQNKERVERYWFSLYICTYFLLMQRRRTLKTEKSELMSSDVMRVGRGAWQVK